MDRFLRFLSRMLNAAAAVTAVLGIFLVLAGRTSHDPHGGAIVTLPGLMLLLVVAAMWLLAAAARALAGPADPRQPERPRTPR